MMMVIFAGCWYQFYAGKIVAPFYDKGNFLMLLIFITVYTLYARIYDSFMFSVVRNSELIYGQMLALFITNLIMYLVILMLKRNFPNLLPLIFCFVLQVLMSIIWTKLASQIFIKNSACKRTLLVYDQKEDLSDWDQNPNLSQKCKIINSLKIDDFKIADLKKIDCVFLIDIHSHQRNQIMKYCVAHNIQVMILPRLGDVIMSGASELHILHLPVLMVNRYSPKPEFLIIKRLFDLIVSLVAFIIISPLFLCISLAIKLNDHGPVFYKQVRLTKNGREFKVIKFRSMKIDAERDGVARLSSGENDDRVTKIGRFLRKVRFDELPQLLNIIKGEMSIVGPRPERPEIAAQYEKELSEFNLRLQAKAGLTGYAQVYGKYNTDPYNKLKMDLMYIAHPSIWNDLKIMFATIKILFMSESTEGVDSKKLQL